MTRSLIRETEETQYSLPPGAMRSATGWWRASLSRTDWVRDRRRSGSLRPRARTPAQHDLVAGLSEEGIRNIGTGPSGYEPALVLLRSGGLGHSTQTQGRGWELRSFEPPICRGLEPCALCRCTNSSDSNERHPEQQDRFVAACQCESRSAWWNSSKTISPRKFRWTLLQNSSPSEYRRHRENWGSKCGTKATPMEEGYGLALASQPVVISR